MLQKVDSTDTLLQRHRCTSRIRTQQLIINTRRHTRTFPSIDLHTLSIKSNMHEHLYSTKVEERLSSMSDKKTEQ